MEEIIRNTNIESLFLVTSHNVPAAGVSIQIQVYKKNILTEKQRQRIISK